MVRRERVEKVAFARLLIDLARPLTKMAPEAAESMLGAYTRAVWHEVYLPQQPMKADPKKKEQEALLDKVERMTVTDDELPPLPKKRRRRR
ncbi:MAG: hypothetical protein H0U59_03310 [Gemmatimonadaceae bacterium]|nr:hypothetical protein [Gemmatimonadaceae bacterium]